MTGRDYSAYSPTVKMIQWLAADLKKNEDTTVVCPICAKARKYTEACFILVQQLNPGAKENEIVNFNVRATCNEHIFEDSPDLV
jgi:hypothetical protein